MKISTRFAATLVISLSLFCTMTFAQSAGIAADKQKQEALNKQRAHQAELQKKYNSLSPEQQVEAKQRAKEYKRGGYKNKSGTKVRTQSSTKPQLKPVAEPTLNSVVNSPKHTQTATKPVQGKPTGTSQQSKTKTAPVLMDANGKPINKTAPASKSNPGVSVKPATAPANTNSSGTKATNNANVDLNKTEKAPEKK